MGAVAAGGFRHEGSMAEVAVCGGFREDGDAALRDVAGLGQQSDYVILAVFSGLGFYKPNGSQLSACAHPLFPTWGFGQEQLV